MGYSGTAVRRASWDVPIKDTLITPVPRLAGSSSLPIRQRTRDSWGQRVQANLCGDLSLRRAL